MNTARFLFYFLLLLLPTQLGRHFFFDFSLIAGVRSSYLAPTVYLTDVISIAIIMVTALNVTRRKNFKFQILLISYLLFTSIFIAQNPWAALYKTAKIVEWILLGWAIVTIKPRLSTVLFLLSVAGMYSAVIAGGQFLLQRSIGGWLWWLGERSFYASTPAIATISWGGAKLLRPYATFPHPNVLGGFLAITLSWVAYELKTHWHRQSTARKGWYGLFLLLGAITLFFTFSRTAWVVTGLGMLAVWGTRTRHLVSLFTSHPRLLYITAVAIVVFSVVLPLVWDSDAQSAQERTLLAQAAVQQLIASPLVGVGLNNSLSAVYPFQPVHNVFFLILVEIGMIGFCLAWWGWWVLYRQSVKNSTWTFILLTQLFFLGLFDHYLVTLQQGMLLLTLVLSLVFLPQNTYTDNTNKNSNTKIRNSK